MLGRPQEMYVVHFVIEGVYTDTSVVTLSHRLRCLLFRWGAAVEAGDVVGRLEIQGPKVSQLVWFLGCNMSFC